MNYFSALKFKVLLIALIFSFNGLLAQKSPIKFGDIPTSDLEAKVYSIDSSASAVILCDYATLTYAYYSSGLKTMFTHHRRIKILKKSGYDWATFETITRGGNQESISGIKGATYRLVGGKVQVDKLEKTAIFENKSDKNFTSHKFTLPNVQEGSVVEFTYQIQSNYDTEIPTWRFQHSIPTLWSEYWVNAPNFYMLRLHTQGYEPFVISKQEQSSLMLEGSSYASTEYHLAVKDAPAIKEEPYTTTIEDFTAKIQFEIAAYVPPNGISKNFSLTWENLDAALLGYDSFGKLAKPDGAVRDIVPFLKRTDSDTLAHLNKVLDYVQKAVLWNGDASMYGSNTRKKVLESKLGNSADLNLLLVAILKELKYEAQPLILSTRNHGMVNETQVLEKRFNYVVAGVLMPNQQWLLLDATDPMCKAGSVPFRCLNQQGRIVASGTGEWVEITPKEKYTAAQSVLVTVKANGDAEIKGDLLFQGYAAMAMRKVYQKEGEKALGEYLKKEYPNLQIKSFKVTGQSKYEDAFTISVDAEVSEAVNILGERMYIKPSFGLIDTENPFHNKDRKFPVNFGYLQDDLSTIMINFPEGYVVEELPKSVKAVTPDKMVNYTYQIFANGNQIAFMNKLFVKKTYFYAEEYHDLRQVFDLIEQRNLQQIVLKKK